MTFDDEAGLVKTFEAIRRAAKTEVDGIVGAITMGGDITDLFPTEGWEVGKTPEKR